MATDISVMEFSITEGSLIDGTIEGDFDISMNIEITSTPIKPRGKRAIKLHRCSWCTFTTFTSTYKSNQIYFIVRITKCYIGFNTIK